MAGFEDLEDDIELPQVNALLVEEPRKLSRLKKGPKDENHNINAVKGIDTPESEVRGSMLAVEEEDEAQVSLSEDEEAESAGNDIDANEDEEEEEVQAGAAAVPNAEGEIAARENVWDEEDEIEQYFKEKAENGRGDEESDADSSGSESDEEYGNGGAKALGDNPSLEDLNAETQRILRETAARDRLGKGQKIEIKPLTGIIAKLKERRALAISRAPKPNRPTPFVSIFDDLFAEATAAEGALPGTPKAVGGGEEKEKERNGDALLFGGGGPTDNEQTHCTPQRNNITDDDNDDVDDLEVVDDDNEEEEGLGVGLVELPSAKKMQPKPSPLVFNPYSQNQEVDEFEDEELIDNGVNSDDESDDGSEHSWAVRKEDEDEGVEVESGDDGSGGGGNKVIGDDDDEEEESDGDDDDENEEKKEFEGEGEVIKAKAVDGTQMSDQDAVGATAVLPPSATDIMLAASAALPAAAAAEKAKRAQRRFLDTEAELSDEDGAAAGVSDDEEEDNLDNNGELADLITTERMKVKDMRATEECHIQWARQQDAKDLQQVLRGLENGFRKRRPGGLDDLDDELHGRARRARFDGDDDFKGGSGAFNFPSAFGGGGGGDDDEEECEDDAMLNRAQQRRLLAGTQGLTSPGGVPLDEDSQAVLGLLARSASESQQNAWMALPAVPPSRLAMEILGGGDSIKGMLRGPSFVGRQSTVVRTQGTGSFAQGNRSFVFGRSENSNSAIYGGDMGGGGGGGGGNGQFGSQTDGKEENGGGGGNNDSAAPVSFANLRQMAGLPAVNGGGGSGGGQGGGGGGGKRKQHVECSTLVSRLRKKGSGDSFHESQESLNAVSAVCQTIAMGAKRSRHH